MVFVGAPEYDKLHAALRARIAASGRKDLSSAFATWLLPEAEERRELASIAARAAEREQADQDFQTIASLGFAADAGVLSEGQAAVLRTDLCRLAGRGLVVSGVPMAFPLDAVGILGVALGTRTIAHEDVTGRVRRWVTTFLKDSYDTDRVPHWQRVLFAFADCVLGSPLHLALPTSPDSADVRAALRTRCLLDPGTSTLAKEDALRAMRLSAHDLPKDWDCDRIALRLAAIDYVKPGASRPVALGDGAEPPGRGSAVATAPAAEVAERAARRQAVVNPILEKKRWKRGRLATEAGVGKNSVYQYLDGTRGKITKENRDAIAEALGLHSDQLPD